MKIFNIYATATLALTLLLAPSISTPAYAEITLVDTPGTYLGLTIEAGAGYFYNDNTNFGAGRFGDAKESIDWQEGYLKPILTGSHNTQRGTFFGGLSYVGSMTRGDGDTAEFSSSSSEGGESELMYIGWESDMLFPALGEDAIEVSVGEQEFAIGDGFLIMDGAFDSKEGAYWLTPIAHLIRARSSNSTPSRCARTFSTLKLMTTMKIPSSTGLMLSMSMMQE